MLRVEGNSELNQEAHLVRENGHWLSSALIVLGAMAVDGCYRLVKQLHRCRQ